MGKKSRLKKMRRAGADGPLMWGSDDGLHALGVGPPPSGPELAALTSAYQEQIRKSPVWDQMVKEFGEQRATEMLAEFTVKVNQG